MEQPLISIVLPVYNRVDYLKVAIDSVFKQSYDNWELVIADDNSNKETKAFLSKYLDCKKIRIFFNKKNLGLFVNLNQAIIKSSGKYILILCSDDVLLENCLEDSIQLIQKYHSANLILSCHQTMNEVGQMYNKPHQNRSILLYEVWLNGNNDKVFQPEESLPLLLSNGSINGNLTGVFFPKTLFNQIGGFNEQWRQVSDWEWVYRVAKEGNIILSKTPRTVIRSHSEQLSAVNFKDFIHSMEVVEMTNILLNDPYLSQLKESKQWAAHFMQLHLWYSLKAILKGKWVESIKLIKEIHKTVGLHHALLAMIKWLPQRWKIYRYKSFPLEEYEKNWNSLKQTISDTQKSN